MQKKYYYFIGGGAVILLAALYFLFFSGNAEMEKVVKSLNAQNYDMAVTKLKEIIYDDEENLNAKGLLFYAQARKFFEEKKVTTFKKALEYSYGNLAKIRQLLFQYKLSEMGLLSSDQRKEYLDDSKDLRKKLMEYSIATEGMKDIEELMRGASKKGVEYLKLSQGDEVDQAFLAILLTGDAFFGNTESGEQLIKMAKMNEDVQPLFLLCGSSLTETLKKEAKNDESLIGDYAKFLIMKTAMKEKIGELFTKNNRMTSAYKELKEKENKSLQTFSREMRYLDNNIFYENNMINDYIKYCETNKNFGIDIQIELSEANDFLIAYYYSPGSNQYFTKVYTLIDSELKEMKLGSNKVMEFVSKDFPSMYKDFDKENQTLTLVDVKVTKKTGYRTEERYNSQKYYSYYGGYSGGYDYVQVPYEYDDLEETPTTYKVDKDIANLLEASENQSPESGNSDLRTNTTSGNYPVYTVYNTAGDTDPYLNVRSQPNSNSRLIAKLEDGTKVHVLEKNQGDKGTWYKIRVIETGKVGYASKKWLK